MKSMRQLLCAAVVTTLLTLGGAAHAMTVSSGFETEDGLFDSGTIELDAGTYSMGLTAFTFGAAGPFIFGITNEVEAYQVAIATFGGASTVFTTVGGLFTYNVGGAPGPGAIYEASITAVPLSPAFILLGSALIPMVRFGRRETTANAATA